MTVSTAGAKISYSEEDKSQQHISFQINLHLALPLFYTTQSFSFVEENLASTGENAQ